MLWPSGSRGCRLENRGAMRVRPLGQARTNSGPEHTPCTAPIGPSTGYHLRRETVTWKPPLFPDPGSGRLATHLALDSGWKTNTSKIWACSSESTTCVLLETPS